ncbi:MAG: hypothetical protein IJL20_12565 [Lachnospiraceae bacterium]|nr:hypothetical protein [Lachnospiraceae bacterium]
MDHSIHAGALKLLIDGLETMVAALELLQMHYETESEDEQTEIQKEDTT